MGNIVSTSAPQVLQAYYQFLTAGAASFGEGQGLRTLLSEHLDFTGSLAGHRPNSTEDFLHGVAGFVSTVRSLTVVREVHDGNASAVLYDAEMPGGMVRFAEFFTYLDGVIDTLHLHNDGQDYIAKGGR
ncbi:hypothetical protein ART_3189 [Arthrobacter sp. PAMC 25486]|uniref:hypothetical protein n=1 Tax=Arthrobacter sp. PAMC 25486 TaxID=1494608 RepID=UPI00053618FB|nr:hypothetical protein [Arthrobacter sp. PAMC 25486]AIY02788.1 hypothetical protein ART_3189 [Arthrobacter sp. PAMC 25486]